MSDIHGILIFNTQIFRKLTLVDILDPSFVKKQIFTRLIQRNFVTDGQGQDTSKQQIYTLITANYH